MSLNMTDTGCLHMLEFHVCHDGGNAGAALARYCWPMFSNPNFSKKSERIELDLTNTQWNVAEDIKNVLKPVITPTELPPEVENTPLSATIPVLANLKRQHLLIGDNDSPLTEKKKKKLAGQRKCQSVRLMMTSTVFITAAVTDPHFKQLS